jgi:hypothetical protein
MQAAASSKQQMLFGEGKIEDMNFDWVNMTISTTYTSSLFILLKTITILVKIGTKLN